MLDHIQIQFNPDSLFLLNLLLALMMFGASLSVRLADFRYLLHSPKAPLIGLFCQFVVLPFITFLLTRLLNIDPSMALGMILVASCPGGSFSNIMTWLARGHLATSVSMTAISTVAAMVMTPLNFAFYASLNDATLAIFSEISVRPIELVQLIAIVLVIPLILGMLTSHYFPRIAEKADKPFRLGSLLIFFAFVAIAFSSNGALFLEHAEAFTGLVVLHNAMALLIGYFMAKLFKLEEEQTRAVTLEVGIQNSGLGLIILFSFFPHVGGMMIITAFWGVWHLVSGSGLAIWWSTRSNITATPAAG